MTSTCSSAVAGRMRSLGTPPDGRAATSHQDLLFEPLPTGLFGTDEAVVALSHRLNQLAFRVRESITPVEVKDEESFRLLQEASEGVSVWWRGYEPDDPACSVNRSADPRQHGQQAISHHTTVVLPAMTPHSRAMESTMRSPRPPSCVAAGHVEAMSRLRCAAPSV